jgi:hypothetical protein
MSCGSDVIVADASQDARDQAAQIDAVAVRLNLVDWAAWCPPPEEGFPG